MMRTLLKAIGRRAIAAKFAVMAAVGILFMVFIAVTGLLIARSALIAERTEKAHAIVDAVWSMANVFQQQVESGAISQDEAKARFYAAAGAIRFEGNANYVFIYDTETGLCLVNTIREFIGKDIRGLKDANGLPFAAMLLGIARQPGEGTLRYVFRRGGTDQTPLEKTAYVRGFTPWHLMIAAAEYRTDIDASLWRTGRTAGAAIGVLMLVSIGIAWGVGRSVVKPLSGLKARMAGFTRGDFDAPIPGTDRSDEIGEMARAIDIFRSHAVENRRLRAEQEAAEAAALAEKHQSMKALARGLEDQVGSVAASISSGAGRVEASSQAVTGAVEQIRSQSTSVSAAAAEAATNVRAVAAAAEQLASSISAVNQQMGHAAEVSRSSSKLAGEANDTVERLDQLAQRVGDVVALINGIAGQTNLLALNATIEAARAGQAGHGFAVVANEVKQLATQTARATGEIRTQIDEMQGATKRVVMAIGEIVAILAERDKITDAITAALEQQLAATAEIARNIQDAAGGTTEVTRSIGSVAEAAGSTASATGEALAAAHGLAAQAGKLTEAVGTFLGRLRAA
jgi:methyl-accepting chemotaxis protein